MPITRYTPTDDIRDTNVAVGNIIFWGTATAPEGYLICDGTAVSRSTYSDLFDTIGTTFGSGDGSTTFNVPNAKQRFLLGKAASGTGSTLGGSGGAIDHTHSAMAWAVSASTTSAGSGGSAAMTPGHGHNASGVTGTGNPPFLVFTAVIKT